MIARYLSALKMPWLFVSFICLIAPVFFPTLPYPDSFLDDPMGTSTLVMFLLSFPMSILAAPALIAVGAGPNPIEAAYTNLFFLFVIGFVQWFWLIPKLTQEKQPELQVLDLHAARPAAQLSEAHLSTDFPFFDKESRTPVERVIDDYSKK